MRNRGVLKRSSALARRQDTGEVAWTPGLSAYAAKTLLEASLSFGLVERAGGATSASGANAHAEPRAWRALHDHAGLGSSSRMTGMTRINMDFIHDVCYEGMRFSRRRPSRAASRLA